MDALKDLVKLANEAIDSDPKNAIAVTQMALQTITLEIQKECLVQLKRIADALEAKP